MGEHDATSIVGQLAGITNEAAKLAAVTPAELIGRFCNEQARGLVADPGSKVGEDGTETARGHCGYCGGRGDSIVTGFDDGYDFMGYLSDRGWKPIAAKGDWPYVVYMTYDPREPYAIAEYCEGDLTVWTFANVETARAHLRGLRDCP